MTDISERLKDDPPAQNFAKQDEAVEQPANDYADNEPEHEFSLRKSLLLE
jgi:hypothetical protein